MKHVPNLFTLLNLLFGCLAVVFLLQNGMVIYADTAGAQLVDIPEKIWLGSLCIGLAAVVDFLDGFIARLFKASSEMGRQLDSLADLVSFGVAPGLIVYQFLRLSYAQQHDGLDISITWLLPAFLLPCAAAWRLARFNLDASQAFSFRGLPVPATGIFFASLPVIYWNINQQWTIDLLLNKWFLYALTFLFTCLMVSRIRMMSLKFKGVGFKRHVFQYALIILSVAAILILKWLAPPVIVLAYVLLSLLHKNETA